MEINNEIDRMFHVNEPGHRYEVHNVESGSTPTQHLDFIRKEPGEDGTLVTIHNGTTNEAVLQVLISRLEWLNAKMPSSYNETALVKITEALQALMERTADRKARGVEGTSNA